VPFASAAQLSTLNVSPMDDRMKQQTERIDENVSFFARDLSACVIVIGIGARPTFCALHALAIDDCGGGTRARSVHGIQHRGHDACASMAVEAPQIEILEKCVRGGGPFGIARHWHSVLKISMIPFTISVDPAPVAAAPGRRNQWVRHEPIFAVHITVPPNRLTIERIINSS
jgi:hypothetical protein